MSVMAIICMVILGLLLARSVSDLIAIISNIHWLKKNKTGPTQLQTTRFIICIPALYEQEVITKTLSKMLALKYPKSFVDIYVVTTSKEERQGSQPTTSEVVEIYKRSLTDNDKKRLHVLNYPDKAGRMAHQINYLAAHISNTLKQDNCYFVVYNADSIIKPDSLSIVDRTINNIRRQKRTYPRLLQQSAVYAYNKSDRWLESSVAKGAAMHQSRWTLTHELSKLRSQSHNVKKLSPSSIFRSIIYAKSAHCVGHGLFVQGSHYLKYPLPTGTLNEDLPYGLMQCALRNEIYPLPTLELATSPTKLKNLYLQKAVWFNPFFEFYAYAKGLLANKTYVSKIDVYVLTIRSYITMIIWLLHSFMWNIGLVLSIILGWQFLLVWCLAFCIYWIIPSVMYHAYVKSEKIVSCFSLSSLILGSLYVLSHSVGPLLCISRWIKSGIAGVRPDKPKTENGL
jgi:hypothetical protein